MKTVLPDGQVQPFLIESIGMIRAPDVWQGVDGISATGMITIAILDTGVDYLHPDLGGCFGQGCKVIAGYDFVYDDDDPIDLNGHGTVAGTAAANGPVFKGVAPDADILAIKVLNDSGTGTYTQIISGLEYALDPDGDPFTDDGADIINMSLGQLGEDDPLILATNSAVEASTVVVAAEMVADMATYKTIHRVPQAITVGSVTKAQASSWFSSKGPAFNHDGIKPEVVAPEEIGPWAGGGYKVVSGTSMATPHVAGAAALLLQAWARPDTIGHKTKTHEQRLDIGLDPYTQGVGLIDVSKALRSTLSIEEGAIDFGLITDSVAGEHSCRPT